MKPSTTPWTPVPLQELQEEINAICELLKAHSARASTASHPSPNQQHLQALGARIESLSGKVDD